LSGEEGAVAAQVEKDRQVFKRERERKAIEISKAICEWLEKEDISECYGEQIIEEARCLLAGAEVNNQSPAEVACGDGTPHPRIIERLRPKRLTDDTILDISWYVEWLVRWVYFALPDSISRHRALSHALSKQVKGPAAPIS
jgi:hypothetical protein